MDGTSIFDHPRGAIPSNDLARVEAEFGTPTRASDAGLQRWVTSHQSVN